MDFELDETQTLLRDSVVRWAEREYGFEARRALAAAGGFSEAHWRAFVDMGWLGAAVAEDLGGLGGSAIETAILMEEFGKVLLLEPFLPVGVLAVQTLLGVGGERARDLVRSVVTGEARLVLAHEEVKAAGVLAHVETAAGSDGRIDGVKTLVLGGPFASRLLVSARTGGGAREAGGIALYLVDPADPSVERRDYRLADGTRASEFRFAGAKGELLAAEGFAAIDRGHAHAVAMLCAEAVGAMDRALWTTRDYLKTRKQFGRFLGDFQVLQHRMAEMLIELELARSVVFRVLAHLDAPPPDRARAVSACKIQIGKSARFVGGQAIQLHGGIGVTEDCAIGHYFKRLTFIDNAFGSTAHHRRILAQALQGETSNQYG
jgi:alkylation response protein AidB-like acyl-CoA dehydrogenase